MWKNPLGCMMTFMHQLPHPIRNIERVKRTVVKNNMQGRGIENIYETDVLNCRLIDVYNYPNLHILHSVLDPVHTHIV
jgi:hypothetical protein